MFPAKPHGLLHTQTHTQTHNHSSFHPRCTQKLSQPGPHMLSVCLSGRGEESQWPPQRSSPRRREGGSWQGRPGSHLHAALAGAGRGGLSSQGLGGHWCGHASKQVRLAGGWWGSLAFPPLPCGHLAHAVQEAHSPAADAGVGAVAHAALGVAVVLKEAAGKERSVKVTESLEPKSSPPPQVLSTGL